MQDFKKDDYFTKKLDELFKSANNTSVIDGYINMIIILKSIHEEARLEGIKEGFEAASDINLN